MTRRGELTEDDRLILDHLRGVGPLTTKEIGEDLDDIGSKAYGRLARLARLGYLARFQIGRSTTVLWGVTIQGRDA